MTKLESTKAITVMKNKAYKKLTSKNRLSRLTNLLQMTEAHLNTFGNDLWSNYICKETFARIN